MSEVLGNSVVLYKYRPVENDNVPFACMRNCDLSIEIDEKITTSQSSAYWEESKPNIGRWTIQGDGMVILNDQINYLMLLQSIKDKEQFLVKFVIDNGTALGLVIFSGNVWINTAAISSPYDDMATYTVSLKGTGEYSLTGTTVTSGGVIIVTGTSLQVKQVTATEGQTTFVLSGGAGLDLVYASRGAAVIAPIGSAGAYNEGITWNTATSTATIYSGAAGGESFIFLIQ